MKKERIAIICENDGLWSLYAWNKTFNEYHLSNEFDVVGFWNCDPKFAR